MPHRSLATSLTAAAVTTLLLAAAPPAHAEAVKVASTIPYGEDDTVANNIKSECQISFSILEGLQNEAGATVTPTAEVSAKGPGRNLVMEITDAQSSGNAFIGHRKSVSVKGKLYENGKQVADFRGTRVSGGGAFGGYKGSCAVIHGCARAIGKDVARWLKSPVEGARLGDLH